MKVRIAPSVARVDRTRFTFSRLTPTIPASVDCEIFGVAAGPERPLGLESTSSRSRSRRRSASDRLSSDEITVVCQRSAHVKEVVGQLVHVADVLAQLSKRRAVLAGGR